MSWEKLNETLLLCNLLKSDNKYDKVAMFDLDHTLIKPTNKKIHPKNIDDWEWVFNNIILNKLQKLHEENYLITIISNQLLSSKKRFILDRIKNIFVNLSIPVEIYVSSADDIYRKPNSTIFELYIFPRLKDKVVDLFYVGDAAGRINDFSDSDRKFAYNIQLFLKYSGRKEFIKFYTPEEFFLGKEIEKKEWRGFNPIEFLKKRKNGVLQNLDEIINNKNRQKVFILIGPPASGKSTVSEYIINKLNNIKHINQDIYITKSKCLSKFINSLQNGQSVILDRTNPTINERKEFVQKALTINPDVDIYYINMKTFHDLYENRKLSEHLNIYRERVKDKQKVPQIAYNIFYKKYEEPSLNEGVKKIIEVPFSPKFKNKEELLRFVQKT